MSSTTTSDVPASDHAQDVDQFADRLLESAGGAFAILSVYLGHRLGLYQRLASEGPATSPELAERAGCHERYVREWLEQQVVTGILEVIDDSEAPTARRFVLPPAQREVLTNRDGMSYVAPLSQLVAGVVGTLPQLLDAYQHGGGVPYADYGLDLRQGQAEFNRPMFLQQLGDEWIPAMPDVHRRLVDAGRDARIADLGCGYGYASIGAARAYPDVVVDGFDSDQASIDEARDNAREYGVADRVRFHCTDVSAHDVGAGYDLVLCCEMIHDLADPVGALDRARQMLNSTGSILVVDERVGDHFSARGEGLEWLMYGWSILHCLPVGMADGAEHHCGGTGTVMRGPVFERYASAAGLDVTELPIDNPFFRFWRLTASNDAR